MAKKPVKKKILSEKKVDKPINEGNLYDKIFKENAESIFRPLIEERLGMKFVIFEPLREKMQTTVEREMDFFYKVTTEKGKELILHLEFQTKDDDEMVYRYGEYHGMALRRKRREIKHLLIYLGKGKSKMKTQLKPEEVYTGFEVINIFELDTDQLLASQIPSYIVSAILTNFPEEKAEAVLRLITRRLKQVCQHTSELSRYLKQLIILSRLRKFESIAIKIVTDMTIAYDVETDYLYLQGIDIGVEKGIDIGVEKGMDEHAIITVINLLLKTKFSTVEIANLAAVTIDFVKKWQKELLKNKVKETWNSFGILKAKDPKTIARAKAIATALLKIKTLSDKIISKVTDYPEAAVKKLRLNSKKKSN